MFVPDPPFQRFVIRLSILALFGIYQEDTVIPRYVTRTSLSLDFPSISRLRKDNPKWTITNK